MADDRRPQSLDTGVRNGLLRWDRPRPRGRFLFQLPAQDLTKATIRVAVIGIEETQPVEMIARRPGIIRIYDSRHRDTAAVSTRPLSDASVG